MEGKVSFLPAVKDLSSNFSKRKIPVPCPVALDLNNSDRVWDYSSTVLNNVQTSVQPNFPLIYSTVRETVDNCRTLVEKLKAGVNWDADIDEVMDSAYSIFASVLPTTVRVFDSINENSRVLARATNATPFESDPNKDVQFYPGKLFKDKDGSIKSVEGKVVMKNDPNCPTKPFSFGSSALSPDKLPYVGESCFSDGRDLFRGQEYTSETGSNFPLYKLLRGLPAVAYDCIKARADSSDAIVCQSKTQAWLMSAANEAVLIYYYWDDGFDPEVAFKGRRFKLKGAPYKIVKWCDNYPVLYYYDGLDDSFFLEKLSKAPSVLNKGMFCPVIDLRALSLDAREYNAVRLYRTPVVDSSGLVHFSIFDYNNVIDHFLMPAALGTHYLLPIKKVYEDSKSKLFSIYRQDAMALLPYKLAATVPQLDLTFKSTLFMPRAQDVFSKYKVSYLPVYGNHYVYDVVVTRPVLIKAVVAAGKLQLTVVGNTAAYICRASQTMVDDMTCYFLGIDYSDDVHRCYEILCGFAMKSFPVPGFRNMSREMVNLIRLCPALYYKSYTVVSVSNEPKLAIDCSVIAFSRSTSMFHYPIVSTDGINYNSTLAIPRIGSSTWNHFFDMFCPSFVYSDEASFVGDSVTLRVELDDSVEANKLAPLVDDDGMITAPISMLNAYKSGIVRAWWVMGLYHSGLEFDVSSEEDFMYVDCNGDGSFDDYHSADNYDVRF